MVSFSVFFLRCQRWAEGGLPRAQPAAGPNRLRQSRSHRARCNASADCAVLSQRNPCRAVLAAYTHPPLAHAQKTRHAMAGKAGMGGGRTALVAVLENAGWAGAGGVPPPTRHSLRPLARARRHGRAGNCAHTSGRCSEARSPGTECRARCPGVLASLSAAKCALCTGI